MTDDPHRCGIQRVSNTVSRSFSPTDVVFLSHSLSRHNALLLAEPVSIYQRGSRLTFEVSLRGERMQARILSNDPVTLVSTWREGAAVTAKVAFVFCLLLARQAAAGHYDGPSVDLNFNQTKPAKYAECDQYLNDSNARRYAACEFGRDEAERMAARYGAGHGRIQGYLRGFSWALYKSSRTYMNDASAMAEGAKAVAGMGSSMQAGLEAGRRTGQSSGSSRGRSDAIGRFEAVVDRGVEPNPSLLIPETQYAGEDNAYEKYIGPIPTVDGILRKDDLGIGQLPVYSDTDALYLDDIRPFTLYDLYFADGIYQFEKDRFYDQRLALEVWMRRPIDTRPKYDSLNQGAPVDPVTGQPINLQSVFRDAFSKSYAWYVNYYFAKEFGESLDEGSLFGEQIGMQVGKRVATAKGTQREYNRVFKESSASTFRNAFTTAYSQEFQRTFSDYSNNPKLSLKFESILGQDDDGILQAGEEFAVRFTIRNLGGRRSDLLASVSGSVEQPQSQEFEVGRLMTRSYTTGVIGRIDSKLKPRDNARIQLNVNGQVDTLGQRVQRVLEIRSTVPRLTLSEGSGSFQAVVENVSTVRTSGIVRASLRLNGVVADEQNLGLIEAGESRDVVLEFSGVDPLLLIEREIEAKVTITMSDRVLDESAGVLGSQDPRGDLAFYFSQLVNGRGFIPRSTVRETRIGEVTERILRMNERETQDHKQLGNVWKKSPSDTMIGKLVNQLDAFQHTEGALIQFEKLGYALWSARTNLVRFIFKSPKRRAYERLCEDLVRDGKISRKDAQ